jgi:ubiquinone/menaquinone biosynthesis C-methylase UbiE
MTAEFKGLRAKLYDQALYEQPNARISDIKAMYELLNPQQGEYILGLGEGTGYFTRAIAEAVGPSGSYLVTDASNDQLEHLVKRISLPQIRIQTGCAEDLKTDLKFDKVWCFGTTHHWQNQTQAMHNIYRALKPSGKAVICDVFQGTSLSRHFDTVVSRYCVTGHEVKFLSDEFARTLCYLSGFNEEKTRIQDLPLQWEFTSEENLGIFIYKLHALAKLPGSFEKQIQTTIESCRSSLGIEQRNNLYYLNWPLKALISEKNI